MTQTGIEPATFRFVAEHRRVPSKNFMVRYISVPKALIIQ